MVRKYFLTMFVLILNFQGDLFSTPSKSHEDVVKRWLELAVRLDINKIMGLYSEDAILVATSRNIPYLGREKLKSYFVSSIESRKTNNYNLVALSNDLMNAAKIDDRHYILTGTMILASQAAQETQVNKENSFSIRYTFVVRNEKNGEWKIIHQHMSQFPARK